MLSLPYRKARAQGWGKGAGGQVTVDTPEQEDTGGQAVLRNHQREAEMMIGVGWGLWAVRASGRMRTRS